MWGTMIRFAFMLVFAGCVDSQSPSVNDGGSSQADAAELTIIDNGPTLIIRRPNDAGADAALFDADAGDAQAVDLVVDAGADAAPAVDTGTRLCDRAMCPDCDGLRGANRCCKTDGACGCTYNPDGITSCN